MLYHPKWTDQLAVLPLINYYKSIYDNLTILLNPEVKTIYDFYLKDTDISLVYDDKFKSVNIDTSYLLKNFNPEYYDYLFHGKHDMHRLDTYKNVFMSTPWTTVDSVHFVKRYYEYYGIDFINKVNYFDFKRDVNAEEIVYLDFISKHSKNYILYHDTTKSESNLLIDTNKNFINLDGHAMNMFNMIKILENSKEIHLIDSLWASFCYLLDAKYKLFQHIPIYIYPFKQERRWGGLLKDLTYKDTLKLEPISLLNWKIVL